MRQALRQAEDVVVKQMSWAWLNVHGARRTSRTRHSSKPADVHVSVLIRGVWHMQR